MISTEHLHVTAKYLVERDGPQAAIAFAANGLQAMIDAGQHSLIPDWQALYSFIEDAASGRLPAQAPTLH